MGSLLQEQRRSSIITALVTIATGGCLIFLPKRSVQLICVLLGLALAVTGVIYVLGWVQRRRERSHSLIFFLPGLVLVALGIWLTTNPGSVIVLIQYTVAGILLFHGLVDLQSAVILMRQRWSRWWLDLVLALVTLVLGVVILMNPFGTFEMLALLIGLSLVYDGVSDLVLIHRLTQAFRQMGDGF